MSEMFFFLACQRWKYFFIVTETLNLLIPFAWVKSVNKVSKDQLLKKQVKNKGYFSEAFLFKLGGGRSPPSGLNRKPRKNPLFNL